VIWILIAILAAIILGLIIFQAYWRTEKPSIPENQQGQERATLIQMQQKFVAFDRVRIYPKASLPISMMQH